MEQTIEVKIPDGYIFDKDNSTENVIRFKPVKKKITYKDVCRELFLNKPSWRLDDLGNAICANCSSNATIRYNIISTSYEQLQQLSAVNKLMNVAKYLNGDWEPNFANRSEQKWYINYDSENLMLGAYFIRTYRHSHTYFKSEELAYQAIEILGEEEVKKALGIFE